MTHILILMTAETVFWIFIRTLRSNKKYFQEAKENYFKMNFSYVALFFPKANFLVCRKN